MTENSPVTDLPLIGNAKALLLENLGIKSVKDLLFHIPFKYRDTSNVIPISQLKEDKEGTIIGKITKIANAYTRTRKIITKAKVEDDSGSVSILWFNQPYLKNAISVGDEYLFEGKIKEGSYDIIAPSYEKYSGDLTTQKHIGKITPYYPETNNISSKWLRARIDFLKKDIKNIISDPVSPDIQKQEGLIPLSQAIHDIHFPENFDQIKIARERLAFDEMLSVALKIEEKYIASQKRKAVSIKCDRKDIEKFLSTLSYKLTHDQENTLSEILDDLEKETPSNRLLNGDVGSGKTIVAASCMYAVIKQGLSCILMVPTTILAQQHFETFKKLFEKFDVEIKLRISGKKLEQDSKPCIIIGTHAVLYEEKLPNNVGFLVVDEQHRFGVKQREQLLAIKEDGTYPHFLMMTATPIPHTLTNIIFGDMDVSLIHEMPIGRIPVKSYFVPFEKRSSCFNWICEKLLASNLKEQAFIVFPLIEESEKLDVKAATIEYESLSKNEFKNLKVGILHGQMNNKEKENVINDFRNKKYNVLISTTVIEVGIDMPDATIMVVENAERFGLAQLHQLRGRVGRSDIQSYAYVIAGKNAQDDAKKRLSYFASENSGFEVAQYDLSKRGPGEVYGLKQSGIPNFKVASINDLTLLIKARKIAKELFEKKININEIKTNLFK
ncbi:ATP-dependent DNA helicase RecG [Candidatus Dojkabacteria bacterium]|jgi:ATP-dependent DNA helicase RecG|nr:ATP-dependent DNA helicase RecG [Candidatus Dojkabacteria bacterium]